MWSARMHTERVLAEHACVNCLIHPRCLKVHTGEVRSIMIGNHMTRGGSLRQQKAIGTDSTSRAREQLLTKMNNGDTMREKSQESSLMCISHNLQKAVPSKLRNGTSSQLILQPSRLADPWLCGATEARTWAEAKAPPHWTNIESDLIITSHILQRNRLILFGPLHLTSCSTE